MVIYDGHDGHSLFIQVGCRPFLADQYIPDQVTDSLRPVFIPFLGKIGVEQLEELPVK
jgi:hypothetical protein